MEPLSKSHASPFTRGLAAPIFRNINSIALRTPFASRCLLRGLRGTRSLNERLRRGTALALPSPFFIFIIFFFSFFIFSHYKFSAPDSSQPRALFDPSRHPLQAAIDAFHPRDKRAYVRGCVSMCLNPNRGCDLSWWKLAGSDTRRS